jgi:hypothetical protein
MHSGEISRAYLVLELYIYPTKSDWTGNLSNALRFDRQLFWDAGQNGMSGGAMMRRRAREHSEHAGGA